MKIPMETTDELRLYFSLTSGEIYAICADEIKNLDDFQIPLKSRPKSCKVCYGRMHVGFLTTHGIYLMCPKCAIKHVIISEVKLPKDANAV